jgi:phage-related protein
VAVIISVIGKSDMRAIDAAQKDLDKLKSGVAKSSTGIKGSFSKMGQAAGSMAGRIGSAIAGLGITSWLKDSIGVAVNAQTSWAKLGTMVSNTGVDFSKVKPQIDAVLASQSKLTGQSKGELRGALTQLTVGTGDYRKSISLLGLTQDLARVKGMDMSKAGQLVGRVAAGNTGILTRYGIVLKKGSTAHEALAAMQKKFGGAAEAYGKTAAGAQDRFKNSLLGLQSTVGTALLPALTKLMDAGSNLAAMFDKLPGSTKQVVIGIAAIGAAMLLANASLGPIGAIVVGVAAAAFLIYTNWDKVKGLFAGFAPVMGPLRQLSTTLMGSLGKLGSAVMNGLRPALPAIMGFAATMRGTFQMVVNWVVANMPLIKKTITTVINAVIAVWNKLAPVIVPIIKTTFGVASTLVKTIVSTVLGVIKLGMQLITGDWSGAWKSVISIFKTVFGGIGKIGGQIVDGLVAGLKAAWKAVTSTLGSLFSGAVSFVKNLLGIKSPSTVFAGIGKHIAAGLANGMTGGIGAVTSAASRMAAAASVSANATFGASATAGGSYGSYGSLSPAFAGAGASSSRPVYIAEGAVQIAFPSGTTATVEDVRAIVNQSLKQLADQIARR